MKIALLGDMAFFGKYSLDRGEKTLNYFQRVAEHLAGFDVVVGNLETPFGEGLIAKGPKSAYICASLRDIELLRYLNVSIVNLANNHLFDYGLEGYRSTLSALEGAGVKWFGAEGRTVEIGGDGCVAFHGYCSYNTNPLGVSRRGGAGVNPLNVGIVEKTIRSNFERGYLNVVSIHSGQEHINYPSVDDIAMARRFSRICPYVYYGHHPHVLQGFEEISGSLIAYSLGNFCFDDVYTSKSPEPLIRQSLNNRQGAILELEVTGGKLVRHRITPIFAGNMMMELGSGKISADIAEYSKAIAEVGPEYEAHRNTLIGSYMAERKRARDINWFIKRLNLNSVGILLRARYNRWQYRRNVSAYLDIDRSHSQVARVGENQP